MSTTVDVECSTVCIDPSADSTADKEGDIQSCHRAPPSIISKVYEELMVMRKE